MSERTSDTVIDRDEAHAGAAYAPPAGAARVERAIARLREAAPHLKAFDGAVELDFEGVGGAWFVQGPKVEIGQRRPAGGTQAKITISADNLVRLIDGQLDPRSGLLFGQIGVDGPPAVAMRFCDAAAGTQRRDPVFDPAILPRPTTDWARAKADLDTFGYCLVKDALTPAKTAALRKRLRDQADGEKAAGVATFDGGPSGPNQRVWALANKGQEFIDLLDEPIVDAFVPDLLGDHYIIFSYSANIAGPGGIPQTLHYDQISVQPPIPDVMIGLNIAFFLDDVTEANGGTRIVPCSGERGMAPDDPSSIDGTIAAEGPAGTALLWDSRVWHGTGPNTSDGLRHVILLYFNRHFMRAQENWALSLRDDVKAGLSDRVKTMLGYRVTNTLGGVEGPRRAVSPTAQPTRSDGWDRRSPTRHPGRSEAESRDPGAAVTVFTHPLGPGSATPSGMTSGKSNGGELVQPAARDREHAGARKLDQTQRPHQVDELVDLAGRAGHLEDEALVGGVDHLGAEDVGYAQGFDPLGARAAHLDQGQFALDAQRVARHVAHLARRNHLGELGADLVEHVVGAGRHDGDAARMRPPVGLGDREALDVVAARGEQADHAVQHARLVIHQDREGGAVDRLGRVVHVVGAARLVARGGDGVFAHARGIAPIAPDF